MRRQRLSSRENCLYHQEQSLEFLNHEAQLRLTAGLPPRINLHALPSTHTLPNESSWLQKWGAFKLKVALKDSFALFANWHTHILTRLDLLNTPGSHRMSTILCSCCFCECPCVCVCVCGASEWAANQITSSCHHETIPRTLPSVPPSPKRRHTAVTAQNKMSCQGRKITQ